VRKIGSSRCIEKREEIRESWKFTTLYPEVLGKGEGRRTPDRSKLFCLADQRLFLADGVLHLLDTPLNDELTLMLEEIGEALVRIQLFT